MLELDRLTDYLEELGLGGGPVSSEPIGDGHSNLTFLIQSAGRRLVLRRPPLGPLAPSANDVVREARILTAMAPTPVPVPTVIAICEDTEVIGAPFFLAEFVSGHVLVDSMPAGFDAGSPGRIATQTVAGLAALHAVDLTSSGLGAFGRPSGYLDRQLRRFSTLLEHNATRPLPELERVADWLAENRPESPAVSFVHGDYRLGNLMFSENAELVAILDWEMATTGDPLADLGYLTAMWAQPGEEGNPMHDLSAVTRLGGYPDRETLAREYAELTGIPLDRLPWYQVLALWKSAIFLEGSYGRYLSGASSDGYFAELGSGVPMLGRAALARAESA
jgi:aminoglycoside phosphotransferase (APT) family kinase protein